MKNASLSLAACAAVFTVLFGATTLAQARDTKLTLPIAAAMRANGAQSRLGDSVRYYFGKQTTPAIAVHLGTDKTSQKTNAFGKSQDTSCNWAFLSAMLRLEARAKQLGADAVVNIVSNYRNEEFASETEFECHDGALMSGVALKGDFVKLK